MRVIEMHYTQVKGKHYKMCNGNQAQSMARAFSWWPTSRLGGIRLPELTKHIHDEAVKITSELYISVVLITVLFIHVPVQATNWNIVLGAED